MPAATTTNLDPVLKNLFPDAVIQDMTYQDKPLLAMLSKTENFYGRNLAIPIKIGHPQGRSASFSSAQNNKRPSRYEDFVLTRARDYCLASIDNELIEAAENDAGSFVDAVESEVGGAIKSLSRSLAISLYRTNSGSLGQIASISTNTFTLATTDDIVNFEVDQTLVTSTADGGGSVNSGTVLVTAVNRRTGVVTVQGNVTAGIPSAAANDYVFVQGDYDAKIRGLASWLPVTDPSSGESFFGVDRSVDRFRLAGVVSDQRTRSPEEALMLGLRDIQREGGTPNAIFTSFTNWGLLESALGSKAVYSDMKVGDVGFRGMVINGPRGMAKVYADQDCPTALSYALSMEDWKFFGLGKTPRIIDRTGKFLTESTADSVEVRCVYRGQLGCRAPGHSGVIRMPT